MLPSGLMVFLTMLPGPRGALNSSLDKCVSRSPILPPRIGTGTRPKVRPRNTLSGSADPRFLDASTWPCSSFSCATLKHYSAAGPWPAPCSEGFRGLWSRRSKRPHQEVSLLDRATLLFGKDLVGERVEHAVEGLFYAPGRHSALRPNDPTLARC